MIRLNAEFRRRVSATKLFNKPLLAILNQTSNPIGLHNEQSLFQRISIQLHFDVKTHKHLAFLLTTDWQRERQALDYLYLIFSYCQLPLCEFPKHNRFSLQVWHANIYCTFLLLVNQHFPGLLASGTHCINHIISTRIVRRLLMLKTHCCLTRVQN
jgi:hypothetical protein